MYYIDPKNKYILCHEESNQQDALHHRVKVYSPVYFYPLQRATSVYGLRATRVYADLWASGPGHLLSRFVGKATAAIWGNGPHGHGAAPHAPPTRSIIG